jgi:hypothetical protein
MELSAAIFIGVIAFIALAAFRCEALFFTTATKLHSGYRRQGFGEAMHWVLSSYT